MSDACIAGVHISCNAGDAVRLAAGWRRSQHHGRLSCHSPRDSAATSAKANSIDCEVDGVTYTARLERDTDTAPTDYECYDEAVIEAWNRDEWHYFGVVIDAGIDGWEKSHLASLWGIEGNFPSSDNSYFLQVANDLLQEAVAHAKASLARMRIAPADLFDPGMHYDTFTPKAGKPKED